MKIQHYFTLLVLVTVVALIGAAEWTQSKRTSAENRETFYSNLQTQAVSFERMISLRTQSLRAELAQMASRRSENNSGLTAESSFSAVAWLEQNPAGSSSKYRAVWAEANTQSFDPSWLKGLNFSGIKDGETLFTRRVDRNGDAFFAVVMTALAQNVQNNSLPDQPSSQGSDGRVYLFGAVHPSVLSAWVDEWVGSSRAAFIFDENGNVVAHSQRQYTGTNLMQDAFVSASARSGRGKLTNEYSDLQGEERIGESLRLSNTNLKVAISSSKSALMKQLAKSENHNQRWYLILTGLLITIGTYFVSSRFAREFPRRTSSKQNSIAPQMIAEAAPLVEVVQPEPELTFEMVEHKTRVNIEEILAKSAEIRKRLQLDFIESVEQEQKAIFEEVEDLPPSLPEPEENFVHETSNTKVKVRRPKVSL